MRRHLAGFACTGVLALTACGGSEDLPAAPASASPSAATSPSVAGTPTAEVDTPTPSGAGTPVAPVAAGPIRVDAPADGAVVTRTFTVRGAAVAFEGALLWELRDASGEAVRGGTTQAGATAPAPFRFTVTAPAAGTYTLRMYEESAKDGAAAGGVDRRLTVR